MNFDTLFGLGNLLLSNQRPTSMMNPGGGRQVDALASVGAANANAVTSYAAQAPDYLLDPTSIPGAYSDLPDEDSSSATLQRVMASPRGVPTSVLSDYAKKSENTFFQTDYTSADALEQRARYSSQLSDI